MYVYMYVCMYIVRSSQSLAQKLHGARLLLPMESSVTKSNEKVTELLHSKE